MSIDLPQTDTGMVKTYTPTMAPPTKAKGEVKPDGKRGTRKDRKVIAQARKRFKLCMDAESKNRANALEDLKFKAGDQWPADIKAQRGNEKRPCLTINTIPTLTHQVSNDLRQNRPAINISPIGDNADKEGAKAFAGMIKAIERDCAADIAYDTAITSAVDVGFGYWRIVTEYESPKSFDQVLVVRRIRNPFSVYLDPSRQEPDGSDAAYAFVTEMIPRDEYESRYPEADKLGWTEKGVGDDLKDWITKDSVRIAEYFTCEQETRRLVQLANGTVTFWDDLDESIQAKVEAGEMELLNDRDVEDQKIVWYKITGTQVLDTRPWLGRWIPIVEVVGEEIDLQGEVIRSGMIRNAKDPARMKNYWASAKTEMVALAPKAPWVGAEGQFDGHPEWDDAHVRTYAKLEYRPVDLEGRQVPPPQRQGMVGVPAGIVQAEQASSQDMMATTGVRFDSTAQDRMYDESGKALREVRRNMDLGSFHYMDNACRSLRHSGRILVDLIPKIYDRERVVTILQEDDTEQAITVSPTTNKPAVSNPQALNKAARLIFNPTMGVYGVTVTTGPSYATRRIESAEQMMEFARVMPQKGALIAHLIAKYSDWPGSNEVYKLLAKALPPQLLAPDPKDMPPQISAFVRGLMSQIAQLTADRTQMLKDLTDNTADRAVKARKVQLDFEAKMAQIFTTARTKAVELTMQDMQNVASLGQGLVQDFNPQSVNPQPVDQFQLPALPVGPGVQ